MLLGTIAAGATTTFNTVFVPQFMVIRDTTGASLAANVIGQINVQGDGVIFNLDGAGVQSMAAIRQMVQTAALATSGYVFQLAQGLVNNKNCYWTFTNNGANSIEIFGYSKQKQGRFYLTYLTQLALAGSGTDFTDLAYLAIPSAAAADSFTIVYNDGTVSVVSLREITADLTYTQTTAGVAIDNVNPARVKMVTLIPAANRNCYMIRYQSITGNVDSAVTAKG